MAPPSRPRRWLLSAAAAIAMVALATTVSHATVTGTTSDAAGTSTAAGCPSVDKAWASAGPYSVTSQQSGVGHTIFRPASLGSLGCTTHPVILWGNGTFASPSVYADLLRHLASHGFIVAAANTGWAGSGTAMLAGLDYLTRQNGTSGSVFYGKVDISKVGATGHSQGGGGAINAGEDSRVDATAPIQPGPYGTPSQLKGPSFWLAGANDTTVSASWVKSRYEQADQVVSIFGSLRGAGHYEPVGDGGGFRGPLTAWFRFHLMGDEQARAEFFGPNCVNCTSAIWAEFLRNAKALQVPGS